MLFCTWAGSVFSLYTYRQTEIEVLLRRAWLLEQNTPGAWVDFKAPTVRSDFGGLITVP